MYELRKTSHNVHVLADPVSLKKTIVYGDSADKGFLKIIRKYSFEQKIELLEGKLIPGLPLKDTTFIIDTLGFFDDQLFVKENHILLLVSCKEKKCLGNYLNRDCIYLSNAGVRKNNLVLSFTFKNARRLFFNCYFNIDSNKVRSFKSRTIDNSHTRDME